MSDTEVLVAGVHECALPEPYHYIIRRWGTHVAIAMIPGYDRSIIAVHASRHRPEEELPAIRQALGFTEPLHPVKAAHEALTRMAS